jgi:hypothetical protein
VGIFGGDTDDVEVLFDEPFMGAIDLGGRCNTLRGYRLPSSFLVNLSYGMRKTGQQVAKPKAKPKAKQQSSVKPASQAPKQGLAAATSPSRVASGSDATAKQFLAALHAKAPAPTKATTATVCSLFARR